MNVVEVLKKEHEDIERELLELESISEDEIINYSNLVHVFQNLYTVWNTHEEREEGIFSVFEKENLKIPVEKILFEHKELRKHREALKKAIESGSEIETKKALNKHGKIIIEKLRRHINFEDEILYTVSLDEFTEDEIKKMEEYAR